MSIGSADAGARPDRKEKNFSGRCVETMENKLRAMGLSKEDMKLPFWVNWIGTQEQAKKARDVQGGSTKVVRRK